MNKDMSFYHKKLNKASLAFLKQLNTHWIPLLIVMLLLILAYYWFEWRIFSNFVIAIDRSPQFMYDFISYYYPMGKQILQNPLPVEGYFYTSFFALLIEPISKQTISLAMFTWGIIQALCLIVLYVFSVRSIPNLQKIGAVLYIGLCVTSFPILHNMKWGQVSLLITACIITAFLAVKQNKKVLAGVLLGFATAIKLYPIYFIVYFILRRDIRTCIAFGLSTLSFYFIFPSIILGFDNWLTFEKTANEAIINSGWVSRDVNSQYIVHVGLRWFNFIFDRVAGEIISEYLTTIGYILALSCIVCVWLLQQTTSSEKHTLSLVSLFLLIPFVIKTSWPHYFVYLPFCQTAILWYFFSWHDHQLKIPSKALYALPILSMILSSIFVFNLFPNWSLYNAYGLLFLSNLLLLVAIYIITIQQFLYQSLYLTQNHN